MAVSTGIKAPANAIVERGDPLVIHLKVETATSMNPGRLVTTGTTAADIIVNTVDQNPIGWLGFEQAQAGQQPTDEDTAYAALDIAPVLMGGHFTINASLKATEVATIGDGMAPAASGELNTWASGDTIVATALESKSYSASSQDIVVLSLI